MQLNPGSNFEHHSTMSLEEADSRAPDSAQRWQLCLRALGIENAKLLSASPYESNRRVYRIGDLVYKIAQVDHQDTPMYRANSLEQEYALLKILPAMDGLVEVVEFKKSPNFAALVLKHVTGMPMDASSLGWVPVLKCWCRLAALNIRLCLHGVSHNDLRQDNILIERNEKITLIDFDQASRTCLISAFFRSFMGLRISGPRIHGTVNQMIIQKVISMLPDGVVKFLRKLLGRNYEVDVRHAIMPLPEGASKQLVLLRTAWQIAQSSNASSPGRSKAYYSFDFQGYHLPGERPWQERWDTLRAIRDFQGLRVLELGCNLGLLSCHLLREEGSAAATAVDRDSTIVEGAKLVAEALDVSPRIMQIDFDRDEDWEKELLSFEADVVFALSVFNWIEQKKRFLEFLGRHSCVIFEGHDSFEVERDRLRGVGFSRVDLLSLSERSRPLLLADKG